MHRRDLLFNNKFIKDLNVDDIPSDKKLQFRQYHENKIREQNQQQILNRTRNRPISNFGGINSRVVETTDIYDDLSAFTPTHKLPMNYFYQNNRNGDISNEKITIEKKTIVNIDSRDRDVDKYPRQNNFTSFLGKTFYNVKKIQLISTEFPNTDQVIKDDPVQLQNNIITWENEEDIDLNFFTGVNINTVVVDTVDITVTNHKLTVGTSKDINIYNSKLNSDSSITAIVDGKKRVEVIDINTLRFPLIGGLSEQGTADVDLGFPSYTVNIKPGNYTATTLAEQMSSDFNNIKRRNGNGQFHFFEVKVNLDTDVMSLDNVITTQLPNNSLDTTAGSTTITVNQNNHGFKTGDRVKMIGVKNTAGIPASELNGDFIVTVLDFNTFTYEITTRANQTVEGGGNTIQTGKDAPFRLLFDSVNTLIQFNTGFANEDSTEAINISNPITTKSLSITNATKISSDKIRITTSVPHGLEPSVIVNISNIAIGSPPIITTTTNHGIELPIRLLIRNTNSTPIISGTFFAIPTGNTTFKLQGLNVQSSGNTGQIVYNGDKISISGLKTAPNIGAVSSFFVENIPSTTQFDISFSVDSIDTSSISGSVIGTSQITINHPNHGFNILTSITETSLGSNFISCKTFLPIELVGSRVENVTIEDGPAGTNTVDILLNNHGVLTSDTIIIESSTTDPIVDGSFIVQVIDTNTLRINFVHSTFIDGVGNILTGDKVTITGTNSIPRIDGTYSIHNREQISNISTGTVESVITTTTNHNWSVGDVVFISNSNSTPPVDGTHTIQSITSSTQFTIDIDSNVTSSGNTGIIINKNRFEINFSSTLTSSGTNPAGIIGRKNNVIHYRIEPEAEGTSNIGGIPLKNLNGIYKEIGKLIDVNNYMVRTIEAYASKSVTSGGSNVRVSSQKHGFRSIQANTDDGKSTGNLFRSISLEGENYVYLVSPGLDSVLNSSGVSNTFAKILLSEAPGTLMFNTFISAPKIFDNPISKIDTMRFSIFTPQGFLFNFNNINYSLSIEITELVEQLQKTFISSRTGSSEYSGGNRYIPGDGSNNRQQNDSGKSGSLVGAIGPGQEARTGRAGSSMVS